MTWLSEQTAGRTGPAALAHGTGLDWELRSWNLEAALAHLVVLQVKRRSSCFTVSVRMHRRPHRSSWCGCVARHGFWVQTASRGSVARHTSDTPRNKELGLEDITIQ